MKQRSEASIPLSANDTEALVRIKNGTAKKIDVNFVCGRIAKATTPWAESQSLLNAVLSRPNQFNDEVMAEVMCAGIVRAHRAKNKAETDISGSLTAWQQDPLAVPELQNYWDALPDHIPYLTSLLLNRLIRQERINVHKLAEVGLAILPHLFLGNSGEPAFDDIQNLHARLFNGGIDLGSQLADFAIGMGDVKANEMSQLSMSKQKNNWLFQSRYSAARIHLMSGNSDRAKEIINDEAVTSPQDKLRLRVMGVNFNLQHCVANDLAKNIDEAGKIIKEFYEKGQIIEYDGVQMDYALALLHNPEAVSFSANVEQARTWLSGIVALDTAFIPQLINRLFDDKASYIDLVVRSNTGKVRSPSFLINAISKLNTEDPQYAFVQPLIDDVILLIRDGDLVHPRTDIAEAIALSFKRDQAIKKIFELVKVISEKNKSGGIKSEQVDFNNNFLEKVLELNEIKNLFGRNQKCFDDEQYQTLQRIVRKTRKHTAIQRSVAESLET